MVTPHLRLLFPYAVAVGALVLLGPGPAPAQQVSSRLQATVSTREGAPVAGAKVEVREVSTGVSRLATTDAAGRFGLPVLPSGTYDVRVDATGFSPVTQRLVLRTGETQDASFVLKPAGEGGAPPEAAVSGSVRVFEWSASDRSQLEERLRAPALAGLVLAQVIPTAENRSLVVFGERYGAGPAAPTLVQVDGALQPAVLARLVAEQGGKTLLGAHRLTGSYLLFFR